MNVLHYRISITYAQYQPNDAQEDYARMYYFYLDSRSFIHGTNISQISLRRNSQFYIHQVDKIASGSFYKTLKLWKLYDFIFKNVFKIYENFIPLGLSRVHNKEESV